MARKKKPSKTVDKHDLDTVETRRHLTSDPLLSTNSDPHRFQAALAIRTALGDDLSEMETRLDAIPIGGYDVQAPEPNSALNARPFDPTSAEATAYEAMLDDIAKLRHENAALVDRVVNLKASIEMLAEHLGKVTSSKSTSKQEQRKSPKV